MNNLAIVRLQEGLSEEALQLLGNALVQPLQVTWAAMESQTILSTEMDTLAGAFFSPCLFFNLRCGTVLTRNTDDPTSNSADLQDSWTDSAKSPGNFFTIFNRVFDFSNVVWRDFLDYSLHAPAFLFYNSGLALHKIAFNENSDVKFEIALQYYAAAHARILESTRCGMYRTEVVDLLLLALLNNMGHIHSHFLRFQEVRVCSEGLYSVFSLIPDKRILTKEEYVFFYMNIILSSSRRPLVAPAA